MPSGNGIRITYEENPRSELTPAGTPATGPNRLSTVSRDVPTTGARISPNPTPLDRANETRNLLGSVPMIPDTFAPDGALAERAYVDDLAFLLPLAGFTAVHTTGGPAVMDPGGTIAPAGTHMWQLTKQGGITPQTAQLTALYANEAQYYQGRGYAISDWTLNAAGEFGSTWAGLFMGSIADPSIVPSLISASIPPIRRADCKLTWLAGGAKADDISLSYANGLQVHYSMGANGSYFPDTLEFADPQARMTGTIPKRTLNGNDFAAVIGNNTFAAMVKWEQTAVIAATACTYKLFVEMPACQLTGFTPDEVSANRRRGGSYTFFAAVDPAAGYDVRITLVCGITAISTYV